MPERGESIEVITRTIPYSSSGVFRLYPLGDVHAGALQCAEGHIKAKVKEIAADPRAFWIGMGDQADSILKNDKRFDIEGLAPWVEKGNIAESQRRWLADLYDPIKEKCLCFLSGNHEETIHKNYQIDITKNLAHDLGAPYGGYTAFVRLTFDRHQHRTSWLIHAWHGSGGAQSEGGRIMRLMRLVNDIQADIYLMGHLHVTAAYTPSRLHLSQDGKIKSTQLIATMTGSWLRTYGQGEGISYGEEKGYRPSSIGCPCICFKPESNEAWLEG